MKHTYKFYEDILLIDEESIKINFIEKENSHHFKNMKVKFNNGTFALNVTDSIVDLIAYFKNDFELILKELGIKNVSLGIDSLEEFINLVEDYSEWNNKTFNEYSRENKNIFDSMYNEEDTLFMKIIEIYYGKNKKKKLRIIDVENSSLIIGDEIVPSLKNDNELYFKVKNKVYRLDVLNSNEFSKNINKTKNNSQNNVIYKFLDKKVKINKISSEKQILKYIYENFIEWQSYEFVDFDSFQKQMNLEKLHKILCLSLDFNEVLNSTDLDISNALNSPNELIDMLFIDIVFPEYDELMNVECYFDEEGLETNVLFYDSYFKDLFDDYEMLLDNYKKIKGNWKLTYTTNTNYSLEDEETIFIFDCSECTYDFLEILGVLDGFFYFIDNKLYLLKYKMLY